MSIYFILKPNSFKLLKMNQVQERKLDRLFIFLWSIFCLLYFVPDLIKGELVPTSIIWYFERQLQWIPFHNFTSQCLKNGIFPAWCPHFLSGFPYLAYPINFFYSPLFYLLMFLDYSRHYFTLHLIGFWIGGLVFYYGLRRLDFSFSGSFLGVLAFIGSRFFNVFSGYAPYVLFIAPLGFWIAVSIAKGPLRLRYFMFLGLISGLGLAYYIEPALYFVLGMIIFFIFNPGQGQWKRILIFGIGLGLGVLLASSPIINLAVYAPDSARRAGITFDYYISVGAFPGLKNYVLSLLISELVLPDFSSLIYTGLVIIILILPGLRPARFWVILWLILIIIFELYATNWKPLMRILFHIPIVNLFALHYTTLLISALGLALLAGFGAQEFIRKKSKICLWLLLLALLVRLLLTIFIPFSVLKNTNLDWVHILGLCLALGLGFYIVFKKFLVRTWLWQMFVLLALIFDLSYISFKTQPRARLKDLADRPAVVNFLSQERNLVRFWTLSTDPYEVYVHPLAGMNLPLDLPGTHSPLGYWRMPPLRIAQLINLITPGYLELDETGKLNQVDRAKSQDPKLIDEDDLLVLKLFNVGNFISKGAQLKLPWLESVGESGDIYFYKLKDTLPRYFLVNKIQTASSAQILKTIAQKNFDPKETALIEESLSFLAPSQDSGEVKLKNFAPGKWEFDLNLPVAKPDLENIAQYLVVIGETYMPGWRAFVGDDELKALRTNYAFLGVPLFPGDYNLKLIYHPYHSRIGLWCGIATIGGWLLLGLMILFRRLFTKPIFVLSRNAPRLNNR